jgi:hypothetical protein
MEKLTLPILLSSVAASFALGFGMAWIMKPSEPGLAVPVAAVAPSPSAPASVDHFADVGPGRMPVASLPTPASSATVDELWSLALAPNGYDAEDRLRKLVQTNPVALRSLLQRYDGTLTAPARELLKSVLSTVQTPDVIAFSTRLANSSNMMERKYGFEMLQSLAPDSVDTRALVKRTLATEQSPEVLAQALAALKSGAAEPEEAEQIVAQLKGLSQHADPAVRSQSITQLGQWDKRGEGADRLSQALADRVPEVRSAAIFAIAQTGVRSDAVKAALMAVVNNPQENKDVRGSALQVLERFSLSKEEYANFTKARAQMLAM